MLDPEQQLDPLEAPEPEFAVERIAGPICRPGTEPSSDSRLATIVVSSCSISARSVRSPAPTSRSCQPPSARSESTSPTVERQIEVQGATDERDGPWRLDLALDDSVPPKKGAHGARCQRPRAYQCAAPSPGPSCRASRASPRASSPRPSSRRSSSSSRGAAPGRRASRRAAQPLVHNGSDGVHLSPPCALFIAAVFSSSAAWRSSCFAIICWQQAMALGGRRRQLLGARHGTQGDPRRQDQQRPSDIGSSFVNPRSELCAHAAYREMWPRRVSVPRAASELPLQRLQGVHDARVGELGARRHRRPDDPCRRHSSAFCWTLIGSRPRPRSRRRRATRP